MKRLLHSKYLPRAVLVMTVAALAALIWERPIPAAATHAIDVPAAKTTLADEAPTATAVLAGGCFWGMEAVFEHVTGVADVVSGYAGGSADTANYRDSSSGRSGHAESVRISYDPSVVGYTDLLQIYFAVAHDPTQVDRQGPDSGPQYRSEIFALDADQARVARAYIAQLEAAHVFAAPIATKVAQLDADAFYPAEAYHQNFAARHPDHPYIRAYDAPKLAALKSAFAARYRQRPPLPPASR